MIEGLQVLRDDIYYYKICVKPLVLMLERSLAKYMENNRKELKND